MKLITPNILPIKPFLALSLLLLALFIPATSHAGITGYYVPSNPDAKNYTCSNSYYGGCNLKSGSRISWWQYYTFRFMKSNAYKSRNYKFTGVTGPCTSSWRGRRVLWFASSQAEITRYQGYCKGPLKPNPATGGGGGPVAAHTCPTKHSSGSIVNYTNYPLCCSPTHSKNYNSSDGSSSSNVHKGE